MKKAYLIMAVLVLSLAGCDLLGKTEDDLPPYDGLKVTAYGGGVSREVGRQYVAYFSAYAKDIETGALIPIKEIAGDSATFDTVEGWVYDVSIRTTFGYDDDDDGYFDRINLGTGVTPRHIAAPGNFITFTFSPTGYVWTNETGSGSAIWNPETIGEAPVTTTDADALYDIFTGGHSGIPTGGTFDDTIGVTTFVRTFSGTF